ERNFAGVSSFGIGGTNAHVVLEQAPAVSLRTTAENGPLLLPISARSSEARDALAAAYHEQLKHEATPFADLCYSASVRRSHHSYRLAIVGRTREELAERLSTFLRGEAATGISVGTKLPGPRKGLVFVFSGQGSHWLGMGRDLLAYEPVFRNRLEECDACLRQYANWSVIAELSADEPKFEYTEIAQPVLFAIQAGLIALWKSWGVEPDAVVGHSAGEVAAAYAAGVLSLDDAVRVAFHRGRLMQRLHGLGAMAAVALNAETLHDALAAYANR